MNESAKNTRRLLEETFPIKEVSIEASREKAIRFGHISTNHIWWARRPLASSRAANFCALVSASSTTESAEDNKKFVTELAKWKNSTNSEIIERARKEILEANSGLQPRLLDPFAGGGSIPLEALRLGCDTYASDYNPVAVVALKCILDYPQRFSRSKKSPSKELRAYDYSIPNFLSENVKKWGERVLEETKNEIGKFYPQDKDGSIPVAYIWARTVSCQNPACGAKIPLMRQYWLSNTVGKIISLFPIVSGKEIGFKIVGTGHDPIPTHFKPTKGTVVRAIVTCPVCGATIDSMNLRKIFRDRGVGQRIVAVVLSKEGAMGKSFRTANSEDTAILQKSEEYFREKNSQLLLEWGISPIPDEMTPEGKGRGAERAFSVRNYSMNTWGDLFNPRQKLAAISFTEKIRRAFETMLAEGVAPDNAKIISTYLALILDGMVDHNSVLCTWRSGTLDVGHTFGRQTLSMTWDYAEINSVGNSTGSFVKGLERVLRVIDHCSWLSHPASVVQQGTATRLPYPDGFFDAAITDPPYYDNVPYSYLSDFFYVWLKRSIGHLYPDLFSTPLTPKSQEIVAYSNGEGGWEGGQIFFEGMLKKSFIEINRVLKPNGIAVIVYAHKSTAGWETLVNSLLDSGLVITAAWPIHTEMGGRLRAMESAALSSSIYIVARKLQKIKIGVYKDVKEELLDFLHKKMDLLWKEGVSGADFLISAIGASIMVFGKYDRVLRENTVVRADVMLEDVRRIVTDYAVKQVLHNGFAAEISNLTRFYLLWRWSYGGAILPFDDARKLSQSTLVDLSHEWSRPNGVIKKQKENICLLGPQDRSIEEIASLEKKDLIDILHLALLLWQKGDRQALVDMLSETGFGSKDSFYRVAQAISETLPKESQEKKLIEGFLAGKERLSSETKKANVQQRLFE
jgi:adenine-specific DNA methylase